MAHRRKSDLLLVVLTQRIIMKSAYNTKHAHILSHVMYSTDQRQGIMRLRFKRSATAFIAI